MDVQAAPLRSVRRASTQDPREVNRRSVLHAVASGAVASGTVVTRAEVSRLTGPTCKTVPSLVDELIGDGLVVETAQCASAGGERPTLLAVDPAVGEIGHLVVVPDGETCTCGNVGCLETIASLRPLLRVAGRDPFDRPEDLDVLAALPSVLCSYGFHPPTTSALAAVLTGREAPQGRLPVRRHDAGGGEAGS